jgi:hypothetical protein
MAKLKRVPIHLTSDILQICFADHLILGQQPPAAHTKLLESDLSTSSLVASDIQLYSWGTRMNRAK